MTQRAARLHAFVGAAAVGSGSLHELGVLYISFRDGRGAAWLIGRVLLGLVIVLPGIWMLATARRWSPSSGLSSLNALGSTAMLLCAALGEFVGFGAIGPFAFIVLAVLDSAVLTVSTTRQREIPLSWRAALSTGALAMVIGATVVVTISPLRRVSVTASQTLRR